MPGIAIRRSHPDQHRIGHTVREFSINQGLPDVPDLMTEFGGYMDILLGREEPPIDEGVMTLMEVADAYFARGCEIDALIHAGEADGSIFKGSTHYKFRTGYLRSFLDLAKRSAELGSRRVTYAQYLANQQRDAGGFR